MGRKTRGRSRLSATILLYSSFPVARLSATMWAGGALGEGGAWLFTVMHIFLHSCAHVATITYVRTYAYVEGEIVLDQIGSTSISSEFWAISHTWAIRETIICIRGRGSREGHRYLKFFF